MTPRLYIDCGPWFVSHIQLVAALVIFFSLLYILWTGSRQNGQKQQNSSSPDTDNFVSEAPLCLERVTEFPGDIERSECLVGLGESANTHKTVFACDCCPKSVRRRDESNNVKSLWSSCGSESLCDWERTRSFSFGETCQKQHLVGNNGIYWKRHEGNGNVGCASCRDNKQDRCQHKAREKCRSVSPKMGRESWRLSRGPGEDRGKDCCVTFQDSQCNVFRKEDRSNTRNGGDEESWSRATPEDECSDVEGVNLYRKISHSKQGKNSPVVSRHQHISNLDTTSNIVSKPHCIKGSKFLDRIGKGSRSVTCIADSRDTLSQKLAPAVQLFYRPRPTVTGQSCYLSSAGQSRSICLTDTVRRSCLSGLLGSSCTASKYTLQSSTLSSLPFACSRCGYYLSPGTLKIKSRHQDGAGNYLGSSRCDSSKCRHILSSSGAFVAPSSKELKGCLVSLMKRQPLDTFVGHDGDRANQSCEQSTRRSQPPRGTYLGINNEAGNERNGTRSGARRTEFGPRRALSECSKCTLDLGIDLQEKVTPGQVCTICGRFQELEGDVSTCQYAEFKLRSGRIILDENTSRHVMSTQPVSSSLIKPRTQSI